MTDEKVLAARETIRDVVAVYVGSMRADVETDDIIAALAERGYRLVSEDSDLLAEGIEAFRLTREYVGEDLLPALEGWSWFDWCEKARARLRERSGS